MSEDLVLLAQRGDHAAFERLAGAAIDRLYAIAHRVLRDDTAAEDAVQDCLIRAWRDIRSLRDPGRWDAWLYRLLLHACRDEQRRQLRRPITVRVTSLDRPASIDEVAVLERRDQLERGFRRLSVEHRMALTLHFFGGYRPGEIADLLGVPEGTVTSRLHYGGRALRAALESDLRPATGATGGMR
jgi:RNA polymerase sigma-70 factor (ECF subfamily)